MMFVVPMMLFKGLHWGYNRFYIGMFFKPLNYTEDEIYRRYDKPVDKNALAAQPIIVELAKDEKEKENAAEADDGNIDACPVAPMLRLFGLDKKKPPLNH